MKKTIAIVGISSVGHHIAFMRLFVEALLELDYKVLVLFPDEKPIKDWLLEKHPQHQTNLYFQYYQEPHFVVKKCGIFNQAVEVWKKWKHLASQIRVAEKKYDVQVDFVYHTWLDTFIANYLSPFLLNIAFPFKWSGMYFHPRHYRYIPDKLKEKVSISEIDIIFKTAKCQNVTVHDEGIVRQFSQRIGKKVMLFPEIADDTQPDMQILPIQEIEAKAKGRTKLLIAGIIDKGKRLYDYMQLAKMAAEDKYFFIFAGPINISHYEPTEQAELKSFLDSKHENCYIYDKYLQEGAEFNAFIAVADIIFLVYENFPSSSNRLTKAAIFKKYVITQNRFCVGEDVQKYGLGETVEEGNLPQALAAMDTLRTRILHEPFPHESFEKYSALHSATRLKACFQEVLQNI